MLLKHRVELQHSCITVKIIFGALNTLICSSSSFILSDVYKDNKKRRNSHEIICGKKFANEIEEGKQTVLGNKSKRPHSTSRINVKRSDYLNASEDNNIKYYCQNTLRLSSPKSDSQTQPKLFTIEKPNAIVLTSLRKEVENWTEDKESSKGKENIADREKVLYTTKRVAFNDNVDSVNGNKHINSEQIITKVQQLPPTSNRSRYHDFFLQNEFALNKSTNFDLKNEGAHEINIQDDKTKKLVEGKCLALIA